RLRTPTPALPTRDASRSSGTRPREAFSDAKQLRSPRHPASRSLISDAKAVWLEPMSLRWTGGLYRGRIRSALTVYLQQRHPGGRMKLLLTSAGIKNASIHDALVELLGKPIAECDALCIPTALYGHPWAGPRQAWRCISGQESGT